MTRVKITMKRFIVHGHESFYPNNSYTVDDDVAKGFIEADYATEFQEPVKELTTEKKTSKKKAD